MILFKIGVYKIAGVQLCCYFADLWSYFKSFGVMNTALFWCACTARGISTIQARLICCGTVSVTDKMEDVNNVVKPRRFDQNLDKLDPTLRHNGGVNAPPSVAAYRTACVPARIDR